MKSQLRVCFRVILVVAGVVWLTTQLTSDRNDEDLQWHLASITAPYSFHLVIWEAATLTRRLQTAIFPPPPVTDPVHAVLTYFSLGQQESQLTDRRNQLWARQATDPSVTPSLNAIQQQIATIQQKRDSLRPEVEQIISVHRIEIIGTELLSDNLSTQSMDQIESATDRLGVSSVVIQIGGLAAYPAMIPTDEPLEDTLITICHEWAFHYLALHPLGESYFSGYDMATINESLVDIVGHEVGPEVYDRYYRTAVEAATTRVRVSSQVPPAPAAALPSFETLLRRIRVVVQADLARGDVPAADAYMAQQQQALLHEGYYVRRLNTAFLAFYGWYAKGGNPYAPLLQSIRQKSGSLAAFLADVQGVTSPEQLRQLAAEPAAELRWK